MEALQLRAAEKSRAPRPVAMREDNLMLDVSGKHTRFLNKFIARETFQRFIMRGFLHDYGG